MDGKRGRNEDEQAKYNTMIESFAVHARNLAEFFCKEGRNRKFTKVYKNIDLIALTDITDKVSGQISHLLSAYRKAKTKRPVPIADRINDQHRAAMYKNLSDEIKNFRGCLKQPYDGINILVLAPVNVPAQSVSAQSVPAHSIGTHARTTHTTSPTQTTYPVASAAGYYEPPNQ
jgi:hypothetical protein